MNKSTFAMGGIMAGFVLYLAMNDRLKVYAALLFGGGSSSSSGSSSGSGSNYLIPPAPSLGFPGVTK